MTDKLIDKLSLKIGIVKNNADPAQLGRLQIFIPSIDGKSYQVDDLPWATYVSPFAGTTANAKVGREGASIPGATAYGMWAIPKNGAQVLCGFLEGNPATRFYLGCFHMTELNRTLPQGIMGVLTEIDETGSYPQGVIPHYISNLTEAGLAPSDRNFLTRGGYERSVSHPSNKNINKPTTNGYAPKPLEPKKSDSQMFCITTPGRHYLAMIDVDDNCRVRLKTTEGNQIIFDDTNERIYISTAKGRNWIELDEGSGKMYFYTSSKLNFHAENDINMYSDQNINIVAKKRVNIQSEDRGVKIQAQMGVGLVSNTGNIDLTASRSIHLKAINGASSGAVSAAVSCVPPPYVGGALGVIRDFPESGGDGASGIYVSGTNLNLLAGTGNIRLTGGKIELKSTGDITEQAGGAINRTTKLYRTSPGSTSVTDTIQAQPALDATVASSSDVKSSMVVPMHESWVRDEDEALCQTPRNKSYKG